MTLQQIFDNIAENSTFAIISLLAIPLLGLVMGWISKGEEEKSPWKYLFSFIIYAAAIPGIFAMTLCVYTFLFQRVSFLEVNVLVYFLPMITMIGTFLILKNQMDIENIPGFGKLSGLLMMIAVIIIGMFIMDRMRILVISIMPIQYALLLLVGLFVAFRFGMKRLFNK
ncbi:MAG: hypothetical protein ACPG5P_02255 [Saprospiraceae bacterium]